ncbi:MAG TPA: hydrogenase maturation nickel metallochaperone HypA [Tepidisphaeraceae bacterium]|jgi:hydrogenase nickel incorporation protein HypA/HybF|nr:hydrogenase maturation nickel metallochaperone HypA [Tepidisphaeraceae bacterium]
MHELSIAVSLLDVAAEEAERLGVEVAAIRLRLGPLSGVVKEALLSAFDLAREESPMPNARLVIEEMPIIIYCAACSAQGPATSLQEMSCSRCGASAAKVISGRELEVVGLEVIDRPPESDVPSPGAWDAPPMSPP